MKRRSIQRHIILVFAVGLVLAIVVGGFLSFYSSYKIVLNQGVNLGRGGAHIVEKYVSDVGILELCDPNNKEQYEQVREQLRVVCKELLLEYIYLYTVDEDGLRHYIFAVAEDDEEDKMIRENIVLGSTSDIPLSKQEKSALKDDETDDVWVMGNDFGKTATWITPFHDADGNVIALIGTDFSLRMGKSLIIERFLSNIIPVSLLLFLIFITIYILIQRRVISPVSYISSQMEEFDPSEEPKYLNINSRDEMQQIADAFDKMSKDIRVYIENIERITEEQARAKAQMDVARNIQHGMVPENYNDEFLGACVSASMQPAREVGGDFYDGFMLKNGNYCGFIGDVSDKGITAALFMVMVKSMLRDNFKLGLDPASALNRVNDEVCEANPEGMFATVFAFVFDVNTGEFTYANGGHNSPIIIKNDGSEWLNPDPGIALGLFEDAGIENGKISLKDGEGILIYTDGITDAVNKNKEFFGEEKLQKIIDENSPKESSEALKLVKESVEKHFEGCDQFDDMTLLVLYRKALCEELPLDFKLPVELNSFNKIKELILNLNVKDEKKVILACDEVLANICEYSGAENLYFYYELKEDELILKFIDDGKEFNPFAEENSVEKDFDDLDMGGMGIGFIKGIAKECKWEFVDNKNVLTLIF